MKIHVVTATWQQRGDRHENSLSANWEKLWMSLWQKTETVTLTYYTEPQRTLKKKKKCMHIGMDAKNIFGDLLLKLLHSPWGQGHQNSNLSKMFCRYTCGINMEITGDFFPSWVITLTHTFNLTLKSKLLIFKLIRDWLVHNVAFSGWDRKKTLKQQQNHFWTLSAEKIYILCKHTPSHMSQILFESILTRVMSCYWLN